MTRNQPEDGRTKMDLHPREVALILYMRRLGNGTLSTVGVKDGVPDVIVATEQRVNLSNQEHLDRIFEVNGSFVPLKKG